MAFELQALIASPRVLSPCHAYTHAVIASLGQGLGLVPMTDELFQELRHADQLDERFAACAMFPPGLEARLTAWSAAGPIAYVEAEYFAGDGSQFAAVWDQGVLVLGPLHRGEDQPAPPRGCSPISQALRRLGASAGSHYDEFDAVDLVRHRRTTDWLHEPPL